MKGGPLPLRLAPEKVGGLRPTGYLPDGTMIVADGDREAIGKDIVISVTSVLQTSAGRMIFGRVEGGGSSGPRNRKA